MSEDQTVPTIQVAAVEVANQEPVVVEEPKTLVVEEPDTDKQPSEPKPEGMIDDDVLATVSFKIDGKPINDSQYVQVIINDTVIDELNLEACMKMMVRTGDNSIKERPDYIGHTIDELDIVKHPPTEEPEEDAAESKPEVPEKPEEHVMTKDEWKAIMTLKVGEKYGSDTITKVKDNTKQGVRYITTKNGTTQLPLKW